MLDELPESHSIRADRKTTTRCPDVLFTNHGSRSSRVDHDTRADDDTNMNNSVGAIAIGAPKDHISSRSLASRNTSTHVGVVLLLRGAGW